MIVIPVTRVQQLKGSKNPQIFGIIGKSVTSVS